MGLRNDLRLLEMAVRRRWEIDLEAAARTVNDLLHSPDDRIRARAASIAAVMEGQNQKDEHKIVDIELQQRNHRISVIASELGISEADLKAIEDEADRDTDSDQAVPTEEDI